MVGALLLLATIPGAADTNLGAHALGPDVSVGMGLLMEIVITFGLSPGVSNLRVPKHQVN